MIIVSHFRLYRKDPQAGRALFRDGLRFRSIDAGKGWSIVAIPPAEVEIRLRDGEFSRQHAAHQQMGAVLYLMCDEREAQIEFLKGRKVRCTGVQAAPWGRAATIPSPKQWPHPSLPAVAYDGV